MWKNRAVLVTGGASFVGSHLVDSLLERGAIVEVADDFSSGKLSNLDFPLEKESSGVWTSGNLTVRKGDLLVIPDADVVMGPTFLETIWHEHEKCPDLAMYIQRWNEPKEHHTGDISLQHLKKACIHMTHSNYGGCQTIRKK